MSGGKGKETLVQTDVEGGRGWYVRCCVCEESGEAKWEVRGSKTQGNRGGGVEGEEARHGSRGRVYSMQSPPVTPINPVSRLPGSTIPQALVHVEVYLMSGRGTG